MKTKKHYLPIASLLIGAGALINTGSALAGDSEELARLRAQVQELDQKIRVLDRQQEIAIEEAATRQKETPTLVAGSHGFALRSADGNFEYRLRGLLHLDHRNYFDDAGDTPNGFTARRIRPTFEGTLFGKYGFRFMPEFGEGVNRAQDSGNTARVVDAYADANFERWLKLRVGKFKPFVGLERLQSGSAIKFIERSYVSNNLLPNRDLGVSVFGQVWDDKLEYAVGVFNGVNDGAENTTLLDTNDDKDYAIRLFATPFKDSDGPLSGLGFGIAATYGDANGTPASRGVSSGYKTPGISASSFFALNGNVVGDGRRFRWSPQAYYYQGPFGLLAEYAAVSTDVSTGAGANHGSVDSDAWQLAASWLVTGEDASFKEVKPRQPFETGKPGWGAWEVVARYQQQEIDDEAFDHGYANAAVSAKSAKTWGAGLNWYLNQWVKLAVNYEETHFENGGGGTIAEPLDREDERILLSRLQFAF